MDTVFVYTLEHPDTAEVRYVGKTNDLNIRFRAHLNPARKRPSHKKAWIQSLLKQGKKPVIKVLDVVDKAEWVYWERFWIQQLKIWGFNLTNHTEGGDGATHANKGSFKKGENVVAVVKIDLSGYLIEEFAAIQDAPKAAAHALDTKGRTSDGFMWFRRDTWDSLGEELSSYVEAAKKENRFGHNGKATRFQPGNGGRPVRVAQYTLGGELFAEFDSAKEAQIATGISGVVKAINGYNKTAGGYVWRKI